MEQEMKLTEMEMDSLREVGNVGVGNAATALSNVLSKNVEISLPDTKFVPISKFSEELGGPDTIVVSSYLPMVGDLSGECILLFSEESSFKLIDTVLGQEVGTTKELKEMEESAFKEVANIFAGAYLSALANMIQAKLLPAVPNIANDMAQSIADFFLLKLAKSADEILCIKTSIKIDGQDVDGQFMLLFEEESLKELLRRLHEQFGF